MTSEPTTPAVVAEGLTKGAKRALLAMTAEWQFCGKATFDANGAWNAWRKAKQGVERQAMKDGKWSRDAYRLNSFGLQILAHLQESSSGR